MSHNQSMVGNYGKQTLTGSIKTRSIIKNNFGMPHISNNKFVPVNKSAAKEQIYRTIQHDHEIEKSSCLKDTKKDFATAASVYGAQ